RRHVALDGPPVRTVRYLELDRVFRRASDLQPAIHPASCRPHGRGAHKRLPNPRRARAVACWPPRPRPARLDEARLRLAGAASPPSAIRAAVIFFPTSISIAAATLTMANA